MDEYSSKVSTIRETIEELTRLAGHLRDGMDTPVEFAICDGHSLQMIDDFDVTYWTRINTETGAHGAQSVMFRGHHHPGKLPGKRHQAVTADVDDELRDLTDSDGD